MLKTGLWLPFRVACEAEEWAIAFDQAYYGDARGINVRITNTQEEAHVLKEKLASKRTLLCGMVLVLAAATPLFSRHIHGSSDTGNSLPNSTVPVSAATPGMVQGQGRLVQTLRVFVHPEDIYPGSVVVKPGKIDLVVESETLTDVSLVVERVDPGQAHQRVAAVRTINRSKRNHQELTLGAGVYAFYEESRPQQQGKIIVDPQER